MVTPSRLDSDGRGIGPSQRSVPAQHTILTRNKVHAPDGIRTRSPRKRTAADRRLKPRSHRQRRDVNSVERKSCWIAEPPPIPSSHRGAGVVYLWFNRHDWDTASIQMFLCPVFVCLLRLNKLWNCLRLPYGCLGGGGTTALSYQYVLCEKNRSVPLEITKEMNKYQLMKTLCPRHSYDTPKRLEVI